MPRNGAFCGSRKVRVLRVPPPIQIVANNWRSCRRASDSCAGCSVRVRRRSCCCWPGAASEGRSCRWMKIPHSLPSWQRLQPTADSNDSPARARRAARARGLAHSGTRTARGRFGRSAGARFSGKGRMAIGPAHSGGRRFTLPRHGPAGRPGGTGSDRSHAGFAGCRSRRAGERGRRCRDRRAPPTGEGARRVAGARRFQFGDI